MVLNKFRYLSDRFIKKPVNWLIRHNVSPNTITLIGFAISIVAGVMYGIPSLFLEKWYLNWIPCALFFLSGYFDVLDGGVARTANKQTKFGAFLDSTLDRLSDSVIILGLMYGNLMWPWDKNFNDLLGVIALIITLLISYTRSRAELEGVVMKGIGFMERAERVFLILFSFIIEACLNTSELTPFGPYSLANPYTHWYFPSFTIVFIILCAITLVQRIVHAYKWLSGKCSIKYLQRHDLVTLYEEFKQKNLKSFQQQSN